MRNVTFKLGVSAIALACGLPAAAQAQTADPQTESSDTQAQPSTSATEEEVETGEVIVSARRRDEAAQTTPVSVTAVSGAVLEEKRILGQQDLSTIAPSLTISQTVSRRDNEAKIRGQGSTFNGSPGVATYFAEVPGGPVQAFYDLENVQVLNGPQGTLFGVTSTGGAILLTPRKPTADFNGYAVGRYGNYNLREFEGAVGGALGTDKLLGRTSVLIRKRDGFTKNVQGSAVDNVDRVSARTSLVFRPNESFENYTIAYYEKVKDGQSGSLLEDVFAGPLTTNSLLPSLQAQVIAQRARGVRLVDLAPYDEKTVSYGLINTTTMRPSDNFQVKNIFAYSHTKGSYFNINFDGTSAPILDLAPITELGAPERKGFSNEFQVSGSFFADRLKYQTGIFYGWTPKNKPSGFYQVLYSDLPPATLALFGFPQTKPYGTGSALYINDITAAQSNNTGIYGHLEFELFKGLTASGGVRRTQNTSKNFRYQRSAPFGAASTIIPDPANPFSQSKSHATTWDATLDYVVTDNVFVYGSVRKGFRPGGSNTSSLVLPTYGPETVMDYELGVKTRWNIGGIRGHLNIDAFNDDYNGIQRTDTVLRPASPPQPAVLETVTRNAAKARIRGFDIDFGARLTNYFDLSANMSRLDAKFKEYVLGGVDISDNVFANAPKLKYSVSPRVHVPTSDKGEVSLSGTLSYQSKYRGSDTDDQVTPTTEIGAYTLLSARLSWNHIADSNFSLSAFATNITNKEYRVQRATVANSLRTAIYGEPRFYGGELRVDF